MESLECMRVYIQGGSLKLLIPVPEPAQTVTWLKNDFKLRALRRGRDVTVVEIACAGHSLRDDDRIADVIPDQAMLLATGHGIENMSDLPGAGSSLEQQPEPGRSKRKYTRGGHKKLKLVAPILESYLPEMSTTSEKERQKFYAKIVALPQMMMAEVNRDEVVSWYKRARKKYRVTDDDDDDDNNGVHRYNFEDTNNNSSDNDSRRHLDAHAASLVLNHQQQPPPPMACDDPLSRQALAAADDFNLSQLHLIPRAPVPEAPPPNDHQRPRSDTYDQLHSSLPEVVDDELQGDSVLSLAHIGSALDPCHAITEAVEMAPPPFEGGLGIAPPISGAQAVIGL